MKKSEIKGMIKEELERLNEGKITATTAKKDIATMEKDIDSAMEKITNDMIAKLEKKYVGSTAKFMNKETDGPVDWKEVKRSGKIVKAKFMQDAKYYQSKFSFTIEYVDRDGDKSTAVQIGEKDLV